MGEARGRLDKPGLNGRHRRLVSGGVLAFTSPRVWVVVDSRVSEIVWLASACEERGRMPTWLTW